MQFKPPTSTKTTGGSLAKTVEGLLPEIRGLIEEARQRAVTAANLSMVALYWNMGRIINTELQRAPGRADYGEALLATLAERLRLDYGPGFSRSNLQDMRRFQEAFEICQPVAGKSAVASSHLREPAVLTPKCQTVSGELEPRLLVDISKHFHLNWSHYRLLLGQRDYTRRKFYFEQAAAQRWSVPIPTARKSAQKKSAKDLTLGNNNFMVLLTNPPRFSLDRRTRAGALFVEGVAA